MAIIEDNHELCRIVKKYFDNHSRFEVVGVAHNGIDGLEVIKETLPDIALIDIIMPEKDGISILEDLKFDSDVTKPVCIMLTAVSHDALTKKALELGADYFVLKPFDMDVLARRMMDLYNHKHGRTPDNHGFNVSDEQKDAALKESHEKIPPLNYAADILQRLGIPSNLNGYTYLKSAIILAIADKSMLESITKILYPSIAKSCNTTAVRVERSIRHAINASWQKGFDKAYRSILGYTSPEREKPTNSYLITMIVEKYNISAK